LVFLTETLGLPPNTFQSIACLRSEIFFLTQLASTHGYFDTCLKH
jgi:hypothetical protein